MHGTQHRHPVVNASLWMLGALSSFTAMAIGGRELSAEIGTFEILFFRSVVGLAIIGALLSRYGWRQVSLRRFPLHFARNLAHFGGQFGWFYAIALIPLAQVFAIEFTTPIWAAGLAVVLLGERMTRARLAAIALGIAGMLIILRPGGAAVGSGSLAVLAAAACYALSHVLTRKLARTETVLAILFYMTVIQLPLAVLPMLAHWVTPSPALWPWVAVVGATALSAHYCFTRALMLADVTVVVAMDFLRLPLVAVAGLVFYGEKLDWLVLVGAAVMLVGNFINILAERARPR